MLDLVLQLCNNPRQNLLDIHANVASKFICSLQVGTICLQYSHDWLAKYSGTIKLQYSFVYCKLMPSVCNIHMMMSFVSQIFRNLSYAIHASAVAYTQ